MVKEKTLQHSGKAHDENPPGRGSGRYAWGSGENPGQHQYGFLATYDELRKKGISNSEIAKTLLGPNATTTNLRAEIAINRKAEWNFNHMRAVKLLDECHGNISEVARRMNKNESTIRGYLDEQRTERASKYDNTAAMLRKAVEKGKIVDISRDTELYMGVTDSTKKTAIAILEKEGYVKTWVQIPQAGTNFKTSIMVLAAPGTTHSEIQRNKYNIKPIQEFTPDQGKTWWSPEFPESLSSKRIFIRYAEDGGKEKDGVIELRKGVEDISLGGSRYSQVRVAVDGTHYMKGMAIYGDDDDIPKGYDIVYNTNKSRGTPMIGTDKNHEVLKRLKINKQTGEVDRDNPFGALIKAGGQRKYIGKDGKEHLSVINKLQDEGDWDSWSRNLSSQFLSKQPLKLIEQQLNLSVQAKRNELEQIKALTNPIVKKKLLDEFAEGCDANAADLSAKGFKRQAFQVLLPVPSLKDNEIYAPNYDDGDVVALVRYPHGGTFEIPLLTVNNKHAKARSILGKNPKDAVGINSRVAERLSGADFDGDTALVIPVASNRIKIKSTKPLSGLEGFDGKALYKLPDSAPEVKNKTKQKEMGIVTNLITDMSVGGADPNEIARAVRHSMVVIDSEKHHLNYKQSALDNNIQALKEVYQRNPNGKIGGASTILSRAKAKIYVDEFKEITDVKKMTPEQRKRWDEGKKVYVPAGKTRKEEIKDPSKMTPDELKIYNAGKRVYRQTDKPTQTKVHQMDVVDDAYDLVRDKTNEKEVAYAEYANALKGVANEARRVSRNTKPIPYNKSARETYAEEVKRLEAALVLAKMNSPKERQAQVIANAVSSAKIHDNPDMDFEHRQREKAIALTNARAQVGAKKDVIEISEREWEAIQAGAISTNKLIGILNNANPDKVKQLATPKQTNEPKLTDAQIKRIQTMINSNRLTNEEIAKRFGVSVSTIIKAAA